MTRGSSRTKFCWSTMTRPTSSKSDPHAKSASWLVKTPQRPIPSTSMSVSAFVVAGTSWLIKRWHASNCVVHKDEIDRLLVIARSDKH